MGCVIDGCVKTKTHARKLCRAHYMRDIRGTQALADARQSIDDGVRSPQDLPIRPKAVMEDVNTTHSARIGTTVWAVMMPYPSLDGTQPCAQLGPVWYEHDDERRIPTEVKEQRLHACHGCKFLVQCAEWATAHEEYGYWGGMTAGQRETRRRARRQRLVAPQYSGQVGFADRYDEREHEREIALQRAEWEPEVEVDTWLHDSGQAK